MDKTKSLSIRNLEPGDSLEELTALLHRAYKPLADLGLRYFATHQTVAETRQRLEGSTAYVATFEDKIVGTIKWQRGNPADRKGPLLYQDPQVAIFGQFGVEPSLQRSGIGRRLFDHLLDEVRRAKCSTLALDTAEQAAHLIAWYERLGFKFAQYIQWNDTNYRSVVMTRTL